MALFAYPWLLTLLFLPIFLFFYFLRVLKTKKKEALKFSVTSFIKSSLNDKKQLNRYKVLMLLCLFALSFFIIGFADPFLPFGQVYGGANIVILLDTSGNMKAEDYIPSRFVVARSFATDLINSQDEIHNVGVITFDEGASVVAFLTPDKKRIIDEIMDNIERSNGKTSLSTGLNLAIEMASSVQEKNGFIVLISDGENDVPTTFSVKQLTEIANDKNVVIFSIGVGSENPYPLDDDVYGEKKYAYLYEELLREISNSTKGGNYIRLPKTDYSNVIDNITKSINNRSSSFKPDKGSGNIFFILGIFIFLIYLRLVYGTKNKIP